MSDSLADHLMDDLVALEETVEQLEERLDSVDELEERIERLEERTDMLRRIEQADQADSDQRRAALWQHCVKSAQHAQSKRVALNKDDVEEALHYPDIHRTTFYDDMQEVANQTAGDVAQYVAGSQSQTGEAELRVDLTEVDETVDPITLHEGGD